MIEVAKTRVKVKAQMAGVKTHGPNSLDVLSGRVLVGHQEQIGGFEPEQTIELSYQEATEAFGQEVADHLFRGVPEEER